MSDRLWAPALLCGPAVILLKVPPGWMHVALSFWWTKYITHCTKDTSHIVMHLKWSMTDVASIERLAIGERGRLMAAGSVRKQTTVLPFKV